MNKLEMKVHGLLKNNNLLKNVIKNTYQFVFSLVPKNKKELRYPTTIKEGYFYGFHDKSPWSIDNKKLLAHKIGSENKKTICDTAISVGYFNNDLNEFVKIGETKAWNWQQGSMLQWLNTEYIIYNDWDGVRNISRIRDLNGVLIKNLPAPIGAVSYDGQSALSYNFDRLNIGMKGYGYFNENNLSNEDSKPKDDGLYLINIEKGTQKLIFSVDYISKIQPTESMNAAYHFFTHCLFSPKGDRFLFLHRWYIKNKRLQSRLISSDIEGNNIHIFPTDGMVSHFTWVSSSTIFAYASTEEHGDNYYYFEDFSDQFSCFNSDTLVSDGHPQHSKSNNHIVTDTYPDKYRLQKLFLIRPSNEVDLIAKLHSPFKYRGIYRCDLHPRWDRKGNQISVDTTVTGVRGMAVINLSSYNKDYLKHDNEDKL